MSKLYNNITDYVKNSYNSENSNPNENSRMLVFCIASIIGVFLIFNLLNTHLFKILLGVGIGVFLYKLLNKK